MPHRLDKPDEVYGAFTIAKGRITFTTGDSAMVQRLKLTARPVARARSI